MKVSKRAYLEDLEHINNLSVQDLAYALGIMEYTAIQFLEWIRSPLQEKLKEYRKTRR